MSIEKPGGSGTAKVSGHGSHTGTRGRHGAAASADAGAGSAFALMLTALDGDAATAQSGLPVAVDALSLGVSAAVPDGAVLPLVPEGAQALAATPETQDAVNGVAARGRSAIGVKALGDGVGGAGLASEAQALEAAKGFKMAKGPADGMGQDGDAEAAMDTGPAASPGNLLARASLTQDTKNGRDARGSSDVARGMATVELAAAAAASDGRAPSGDRTPSSSAPTLANAGSEGAWGSPGWLHEGRVGGGDPAGGTGSEVAAPTPDQFVAEQVNYWVSQNVQNAQLKLDGLGADKVEVSISMSGNEAQVDFRTDQLETRHMLEGAVSQLKDMLSREGVVLSGVSVGTSSPQQGESQRQPRQPTWVRQGKAEVLTPVTEGVTGHARRASGRALDLFV